MEAHKILMALEQSMPRVFKKIQQAMESGTGSAQGSGKASTGKALPPPPAAAAAASSGNSRFGALSSLLYLMIYSWGACIAIINGSTLYYTIT